MFEIGGIFTDSITWFNCYERVNLFMFVNKKVFWLFYNHYYLHSQIVIEKIVYFIYQNTWLQDYLVPTFYAIFLFIRIKYAVLQNSKFKMPISFSNVLSLVSLNHLHQATSLWAVVIMPSANLASPNIQIRSSCYTYKRVKGMH